MNEQRNELLKVACLCHKQFYVLDRCCSGIKGYAEICSDQGKFKGIRYVACLGLLSLSFPKPQSCSNGIYCFLTRTICNNVGNFYK